MSADPAATAAPAAASAATSGVADDPAPDAADVDTDTGDDTPTKVDGRTARAQRTRDAVVDALLDLLDEGDLRPTAPRIAERAGVSLRSVFQHFSDLDSLFLAAADRHMRKIRSLMVEIDPAAPLDDRIGALVAQRARIYETSSPIRRAGGRAAPYSEAVRNVLTMANSATRSEVEHIFASELAAADDPAVTLEVVDVATSWMAWERLRTEQHLDPDAATAVVVRLVRSTLVG